jgi:hypothetical protein
MTGGGFHRNRIAQTILLSICLGRVFKMQGDGKVAIAKLLSLAPGFSPVLNHREQTSRFNGFRRTK